VDSTDNLTSWQKYKQNLGSTRPWDLIDPHTNWASEEKAHERFSICKECPFFIKLTGQCKKCGCFMAAKTKLEEAECPEHKW
jgi:hypothetical protein